MFNALKYIKSLEDVGFPREQAEAQVQLVIDSFQENAATRAEMAELKSEIRSEMAELKSELKSEMAILRTDFAVFGSKLSELKTDLVFRLGGIIVFCTGA